MSDPGSDEHVQIRFSSFGLRPDRARWSGLGRLAALPPKRILVIRGGGLGDFLLTLPTLRALARKWPGSAIEILGRPRYARLAVESGYARVVHDLDRAFYAPLFGDNLVPGHGQRHPLAVHLDRFQLVLSFLEDREGGLRHNLSSLGVPFVVVPRPHQGRHACRQFAGALAPIKLPQDELEPKLHLGADTLARGCQRLHSVGDGRNWIAIHPGSGSSRKNWPASHFAATVRWLAQHGDSSLVLVQGEADEEAVRQTQAALQSQSVPTLPALPALSLAGVLSNCAALLGNDSGISHLAAAVGTPTAALFGPTRRRVWRPLGSHVHALRFESIQPERVGKLLLSVRKSALSPYLVWKSHAAQTDGKIS